MPSRLGIKIDQRQEEEISQEDEALRDFDIYLEKNPLFDRSKAEAVSENRVTITSSS